jgi:hypothetical protein
MDADLILTGEVVTLFPDGLVGMLRKLRTNKPSPLPVMKTEGTPVT